MSLLKMVNGEPTKKQPSMPETQSNYKRTFTMSVKPGKRPDHFLITQPRETIDRSRSGLNKDSDDLKSPATAQLFGSRKFSNQNKFLSKCRSPGLPVEKHDV